MRDHNDEEASSAGGQSPNPVTEPASCPVESDGGQLLELVGGELGASALGVRQEHAEFDLGPVLQSLYVTPGDGQGAGAGR